MKITGLPIKDNSEIIIAPDLEIIKSEIDNTVGISSMNGNIFILLDLLSLIISLNLSPH